MSVDIVDMSPHSAAVTPRQNDPSLAGRCAAIDITDSAEPAVVFTGLASACVTGGVSDQCIIWIVEAGQPGYRIERPAAPLDVTARPGSVPVAAFQLLPITGLPLDGQLGFHGEMALLWDRATDPDAGALTRLLVDRAVAAIHQARLTDVLAAGQQRIADLQVALDSNRDIGAAIGILMARRVITHQEAFAVLRQASQDTNRTLSEVAADVLHQGDLGRAGPKW